MLASKSRLTIALLATAAIPSQLLAQELDCGSLGSGTAYDACMKMKAHNAANNAAANGTDDPNPPPAPTPPPPPPPDPPPPPEPQVQPDPEPPAPPAPPEPDPEPGPSHGGGNVGQVPIPE